MKGLFPIVYIIWGSPFVSNWRIFDENFGENDTIVAISTPPGEGGIGIIRISGENSGIVASKLFKCAKRI